MTEADAGVPAPDPALGGFPARPAATVIIGRNHRDATEVLMVRRSATVAFANAWTFPGGKVEPDDAVDGYVVRPVADTDPADDPALVASAKQAAVRETAEEAGIDLNVEDLVAFSYWLPPATIAKRFATWFFWTTVEADTDVAIDNSEIVDYRWIAPQDAIDALPSEFPTAPPTWVTLYDLARWERPADVTDGAAQRPVPHYYTELMDYDDGLVALWQDDAAYGAGDADALDRPGPRHRLWMPRGHHRRYELPS